MSKELNEREKTILRCVIQNFILTANPVGSRVISKKYEIGISPASIRNVMVDLEELGLIYHPHTSAGRIPTDKGYRLYVDLLMEEPKLTQKEKISIDQEIDLHIENKEELLRLTSQLLSRISLQLALVSYPDIVKSVLEKIQLISLPHNKFLIILSLKSGFIKTITLEIPFEIPSDKLENLQNILNERIGGLSIDVIKKTFQDRVKDLKDEKTGIIRMFLSSADKIFSDFQESDKVHLSGVKNIIKSKEFNQNENIQGIVEMIEDKQMVLHILDHIKENSDEKVVVTIGTENKYDNLVDYSLITAQYDSGDTSGVIGIIGPRRMNYSKMIAVVDYISTMLTQILTKEK